MLRWVFDERHGAIREEADRSKVVAWNMAGQTIVDAHNEAIDKTLALGKQCRADELADFADSLGTFA